MSRESVLQSSRLALMSCDRLRPTIIASNYAWLLDVLKLKRKDFSIRMPPGPSNITPAPAPYRLEEPSTCIVHQSSARVC